MSFYINAWLDRAKPFVSVCNRVNKKEIIRFEQQELSTLLHDGDLCLNDFCSSDSSEQQILVKELLLLRCCYTIRSEVDILGQQLGKRTSNVLRLSPYTAGKIAENDPLWLTGAEHYAQQP